MIDRERAADHSWTAGKGTKRRELPTGDAGSGWDVRMRLTAGLIGWNVGLGLGRAHRTLGLAMARLRVTEWEVWGSNGRLPVTPALRRSEVEP